MIKYLVSHRAKFNLYTREWVLAWLRRLASFPSLVSLLWERNRLVFLGCEIAAVAVIAKLKVHGDRRFISIDVGSCLGRVYIQAHASVAIGRCVVINDGVKIVTGSHNVHSPTYEHVFRPIKIGDYAWVAMDAMILQGVSVGRGAVIGARTVVTKDVPDFAIVAGNPAKLIGFRRACDFTYSPFSWFGPIQAWVGVNPFFEKAHKPGLS